MTRFSVPYATHEEYLHALEMAQYAPLPEDWEPTCVWCGQARSRCECGEEDEDE
jgi:hypothetical protein